MDREDIWQDQEDVWVDGVRLPPFGFAQGRLTRNDGCVDRRGVR